MQFQIHDIRFHVLPMRTRFPFKYGIASMSALPHLFVTADLSVDGKPARGLASEGLPPKWFTKNLDTDFETDLAEMLAVIQNASRLARLAASKPIRFFPWWQELYQEQAAWASVKQAPSLLANLGVSLMERTILDGLCKASGIPLHRLLGSEALGIRLGEVRPELEGITVAQTLAPQPLSRIAVRHTVGLGDPLRTQDIPEQERLHDGLPHALDESIRAYGLSYFKIKVCGQAETDLPRLRLITSILTQECPQEFHVTLDGNEQFQDLASFRDFYETLRADPALAPLFQNLLLIEQPLHRAHALTDDVAPAIAGWSDGPGLIIDEADGALADLPRALDLGYCGTSHKNCKGIVKGLANAALLKVRQKASSRPLILSGEDLANVGPVAMLQDLAMMSALGITHVERNGHHYFRGLSMHTDAVQSDTLKHHPDLYRLHEAGFPTLDIRQGHVALDSVNAAPFGCGLILDAEAGTPLNDWIKQGGMATL
ncbi:hypothetical protein [Prosthecobacter sp. SYSU 5D2]|uniref:hypothetical protein n=1 Tax=Prosthecobacter sp. SYSU 5D2 TaxID=3134134 RepID=UPI0031FE910F